MRGKRGSKNKSSDARRVKAQKKQESADVHSCQEESLYESIRNLKTIDPDFYAFLQENDKEILEFSKEVNITPSEDPKKKNSICYDAGLKFVEQGVREPIVESFFELLHAAEFNTSFHSIRSVINVFRNVVNTYNEKNVLPSSDAFLSTLLKDKKQKKKSNKDISFNTSEVKPETRMQGKVKSINSITNASSEKDETNQVSLDSYYCIIKNTIDKFDSLVSKIFDLRAVDKALPPQEPCSVWLPKKSSTPLKMVNFLEKFWLTMATLLKQCLLHIDQATSCITNVLNKLSNQSLLRWLSPVRKHILVEFVENLVSVWLLARHSKDHHLKVSLEAFTVIQSLQTLTKTLNFCCACQKKSHPKENINFIAEEAEQAFLSLILKRYLTLIEKIGVSYSSISGFNFLEDCIVQMCSLANDNVVYRVMFTLLRKIGVMVRNTMRSKIPQKKDGKKMSIEKSDAISQKRLNSTGLIYHWYFILTVKLIILVISVKPKTLNLLTFPISVILTCVMQIRFNNPIWSPFILHCFKLQCLLMSKLNTFVPLGSLLLSFGDMIIKRLKPLMLAQKTIKQKQPVSASSKSSHYSNPSHIGRPAIQRVSKLPSFAPPSKGTTIAKYFDVDMILSLKTSNMDNMEVLESQIERWVEILIDYYGLICYHPSFPECVAPFLQNYKTFCRSQSNTLCSVFLKFVSLCEKTCHIIREKRFNLDPLAVDGSLRVLNFTTLPLADYRLVVLEKRNAEFKQRLFLHFQRGEVFTEPSQSAIADTEKPLSLVQLPTKTAPLCPDPNDSFLAKASDKIGPLIIPFNLDSESDESGDM
ncbi:uncharacterized protein LOC128883271 [Hylaeus volcanicus]|uniref:uncharacterized protein LOC128883271 n=1 Tax=Hylaeus volcanicus TaxID=313075 RepID=UPI0023B85B73|nr:uncharacterized protein LOC128883271 [Hylaeus volcanicus]